MTPRIPQFLRDFWKNVIADQFVAAGRASLDFPSTGAGLQSQLTITTAPAGGALPGDLVDLGCETIEENTIITSAKVTAADTVTITCVNNSAGAVDPTAKVYRVFVRRQGRNS